MAGLAVLSSLLSSRIQTVCRCCLWVNFGLYQLRSRGEGSDCMSSLFIRSSSQEDPVSGLL